MIVPTTNGLSRWGSCFHDVTPFFQDDIIPEAYLKDLKEEAKAKEMADLYLPPRSRKTVQSQVSVDAAAKLTRVDILHTVNRYCTQQICFEMFWIVHEERLQSSIHYLFDNIPSMIRLTRCAVFIMIVEPHTVKKDAFALTVWIWMHVFLYNRLDKIHKIVVQPIYLVVLCIPLHDAFIALDAFNLTPFLLSLELR